MDWLRLRRALEVGRIIDLEQRRKLWEAEKIGADAFTPDEWREILINDKLAQEAEADGGQ